MTADRARPDVRLLAALDAGLLDEATAREVRAAAEADPASRAVLDALAATRAELAAEPDPPVPPATRLQALMAAARLRLSADVNLHDLARARAHLLAAASINPRVAATVPAIDLLVLIQQESESQDRARNERSLRNTVKQLQDELARAQEDLSKKDEALHRATEKLLERAPKPH